MAGWAERGEEILMGREGEREDIVWEDADAGMAVEIMRELVTRKEIITMLSSCERDDKKEEGRYFIEDDT